MQTIEATASTPGSPQRVWSLLADARKWPQWGSWSKAEIEGGGDHEPGAIRVLVRGPFRTRERVTDWVPEERMAYEVLDGLRVRGYRSAVTLEERHDGGTTIRWRSTYDHAGPFTALMLRLAVRDAARRLAKAASRPADEFSPA